MEAEAPFLFTKLKAPSWASWQVSAIFVYTAESSKLGLVAPSLFKTERSKLGLVAGKRHLCLQNRSSRLGLVAGSSKNGIYKSELSMTLFSFSSLPYLFSRAITDDRGQRGTL
jgi:hypothetical protein